MLMSIVLPDCEVPPISSMFTSIVSPFASLTVMDPSGFKGMLARIGAEFFAWAVGSIPVTAKVIRIKQAAMTVRRHLDISYTGFEGVIYLNTMKRHYPV
jgi:hypothetical protein